MKSTTECVRTTANKAAMLKKEREVPAKKVSLFLPPFMILRARDALAKQQQQ